MVHLCYNKFLAKVCEVSASLKYNSERVSLLEEVLKSLLVDKNSQINTVDEARKIYEQSVSQNKRKQTEQLNELLKSHWFKTGELLISNISSLHVPWYVSKKFLPYNKQFKEKFGFGIDSLLFFSLILQSYLQYKQQMLNFEDLTYQFNSEAEYGDLGFVADPPTDFVRKWSKIIEISMSELEQLFYMMPESELNSILKNLSLDIENLPKKEDMRFYLTPLLQAKNKVFVLTPKYLVVDLPLLCESLLHDCKCYLNSKGRTFEKLVQETLRALPFNSMAFNLRYGANYEVDAVVKFKESFWAVEASSHPPSLKSIKGNLMAIQNDIKKTVTKCIKQGSRCIKHAHKKPLNYFSKNVKTKGVIIVVDGIYPQLNINSAMELFEEDLPVYIINWFDLASLLEEPEVEEFENFLLWRSKRPMPIVCFDEKDYWAYYFDYYKNDKKFRAAFKTAQKKQLRVFYISHRFNNKDYLGKLVRSK